jgi:Cu(I)/Ag(I) efflux system membrane fusion protein
MPNQMRDDDPKNPSPPRAETSESMPTPRSTGGGRPSEPPRRRARRGTTLVATALGGLIGAAGVYLAMRVPQNPTDATTGAPTGTGVMGDPAPAGGAGSTATAPAVAARGAAVPKKKAPIYRCPMHPAITSDHPGVCPICGMTLVRDAEPTLGADDEGEAAGGVAAAGHAAATGVAPGAADRGAAGQTGGRPRPGPSPVEGLATVSIDPGRQQMIGLRTTRATRATMNSAWRTVGRVEVDPTRVRRVNVKVESYVERVFADFVGKPVRQGQPLIAVYSPSLLAAEEEYLLAVKTRRQLDAAGMPGTSGEELVAASRRKLELWDVPPAAIQHLEATGVAGKSLTLVSPISGVITAKNVVEGATLRPGDTPYEITDLRMVWVMADAYESDITRVHVGMGATLTLSAYPGRVFDGRVEFVDPLVDPNTRTAKVHLHFANPAGALKPEMFGEVVFRGVPRLAVRIPSDAIIRTGERDVVFVALGAGKFAPREVHLGASDGDFVEVASGLGEGQEVVTRANFLVDSESRLRASLASLAGK